MAQASAQYSAADLQQQLAGLMAQIAVLSQENAALNKSMLDMAARLVVAEQNTGTGGSGAHTSEAMKGGLYDKRLYEPEKLVRHIDFKEWAEDFFEFVEMCDSEVAGLLAMAKVEKEVCTATGSTLVLRQKSKALHRMLKRSITLLDARRVVVLAPGKNPYEAWRLLHMKFDPLNDSTAGAVVRKLVDF